LTTTKYRFIDQPQPGWLGEKKRRTFDVPLSHPNVAPRYKQLSERNRDRAWPTHGPKERKRGGDSRLRFGSNSNSCALCIRSQQVFNGQRHSRPSLINPPMQPAAPVVNSYAGPQAGLKWRRRKGKNTNANRRRIGRFLKGTVS